MSEPNAAALPTPARTSRRAWVRWAAGGAVVVVIIAAGLTALKLRKKTQLSTSLAGQTLGVAPVFGVKESGFYGPEETKERGKFRWTNGAARLEIPVDKPPRAVAVRAALKSDGMTRITVRVNDHTVFDEGMEPQQDWLRTFDLTGQTLGPLVTVEVASDVFIPGDVNPQSPDRRKLGLCLRGVTLIPADADFVGTPLGIRPVPGVDEEGFHQPESTPGGNPYRWTNGSAKLTVPLGSRRPRALVIETELPRINAPSVTIRVNGRTLVDEKPKVGGGWKRELPLAGVDLGDRAVIEIASATADPGPERTDQNDRRRLGARVNKLELVGD